MHVIMHVVYLDGYSTRTDANGLPPSFLKQKPR